MQQVIVAENEIRLQHFMSPVRDTRCQIAARLFDTEKGNTRERKHLITTPLRLSQGFDNDIRLRYVSAIIPAQ